MTGGYTTDLSSLVVGGGVSDGRLSWRAEYRVPAYGSFQAGWLTGHSQGGIALVASIFFKVDTVDKHEGPYHSEVHCREAPPSGGVFSCSVWVRPKCPLMRSGIPTPGDA